jgi:hypothetical protein
MPIDRQSDEEGFSLLESLVAFTLLSMVLVISFDVFGTGAARLVAAYQSNVSDDKLQNVLSQLEAGLPIRDLEPDVIVKVERISLKNSDEAAQVPFKILVTLKNEPSKSLETILLGKEGDFQ